MRDSLETITIGLDAIEKTAYPTLPPMPGSVFGFNFTPAPDEAVEERKKAHVHWLLAKGYQDLTRAVKQTLEEAFMYLSMIGMPAGSTSARALGDQIRGARRTAQRMQFGEIMDHVSARLTAPLTFTREFHSLQKVRNCMEHRAGIVRSQDTGGAPTLKLTLPTMDFLIVMDGKEYVFEEGFEVTHEDGADLVFRRGQMEREFAMGQRIELTGADLQRAIHACFLFASDLQRKLPQLPPMDAPEGVEFVHLDM